MKNRAFLHEIAELSHVVSDAEKIINDHSEYLNLSDEKRKNLDTIKAEIALNYLRALNTDDKCFKNEHLVYLRELKRLVELYEQAVRNA